jgi:hypothetical protein
MWVGRRSNVIVSVNGAPAPKAAGETGSDVT